MLKKNVAAAWSAIASLVLVAFTPMAAVASETCPGGTFAGGTGTSLDAYRITNVQEFLEMENCTANYTHFEIANDIDFSDSTNASVWAASSQAITRFNGVLDGDGNRLSNIVITKSTERNSLNRSGLLLEVSGTSERPASITNLEIDGLEIDTEKPLSNNLYTGLISEAKGSIQISGLRLSNATVSSEALRQGILIGEFNDSQNGLLSVQDSEISGDLEVCKLSLSECGGLIGFAQNAKDIRLTGLEVNVSFKDVLKAFNPIGGLIGFYDPRGSSTSLTVENVLVKFGHADGLDTYRTGGLIGRFDGNGVTNRVTIRRTIIDGSVPSSDASSALFGFVREYNTTNDIRISVEDSILAVNVGTASTSRGLIIGESLDLSSTTSISLTRVFNAGNLDSTNLVAGGNYSIPSGNVTAIAAADRSKTSSYPGLTITENLADTADWYVQVADGQPELFGGYPVPKRVADLGYLGNSYFFEPNGGTGTRVGKIGTGTNEAAEVIANPFSRTDFTFSGWNTLSGGGGTDYAAGETYTGSNGDRLFAKWTAVAKPEPAPVFRPYTGPEPFFNGIEMLGCAVSDLTITGTTLYNLDRVTVGGIEVDFEIVSDRVLNLDLGCLPAGSHDLTFHSRWGENTAKGKVVVVEEPVSITPAINQKVNAGSFKGYVAVYALGHEGKRLSAKIGKDWVVIPEIPARVNNLYRVTDFTGAGVDIQVRIYIDRELLETIPLTTK